MITQHIIELSPLADTNKVALVNVILIGAFFLGYYLFDKHDRQE